MIFFPEPVWIKYTFCFLAKYLKEFYSVLWCCDAGLWSTEEDRHVTCGKYWAIFQITVRKWSVNKCGKCECVSCVTRCHLCHWSVIMRGGGRPGVKMEKWSHALLTTLSLSISQTQDRQQTVLKDSLWVKMKTLNYFHILFMSFSSRVSGTDDT